MCGLKGRYGSYIYIASKPGKNWVLESNEYKTSMKRGFFGDLGVGTDTWHDDPD